MNLNKKIRKEVARELADKATSKAREDFEKYCASVAQVTVDAIWRRIEKDVPEVSREAWMHMVRGGYVRGISRLHYYVDEWFRGELPSGFSEGAISIKCPVVPAPATNAAESYIPKHDRDATLQRRKDILAAYSEVYDASLQILNTCRTLKQLEATLPEAAALVPKPAPTGKHLVDSKLVGQVQAMLEKGVPA